MGLGEIFIRLIIVAALGYALLRFGRWTDKAFKEMDEDLDRAFEQQERRNTAIEKLGDWLDKH